MTVRHLPWLFAASLATSVPAAADPPLAWRGSTELATGGGERGPWRQNQSRYDYVDDPTVAIGERGEIGVAWVDQGRKDVFFQRLPSGVPVNVSRSPDTFSWLPRLVLDPHQGAYFLLWQEIIFSGGSHGGDILFARSEDGGETFSPPRNLSRSVAGDGKGRTSRDRWHNGSLDLAAGADGAVYAAWTEYEGRLLLSVSSDAGRSFSAPQHVAGDGARPARAPSLALGPDRTLYLAWTVGENASADIRIARSTDGGASFGEAGVVARTQGYSDAPKLAFDPHGVLHVAFSEGQKVLYTRSTDGARSFEVPRAITEAGKGFPALSVDAQGAVYVLWELPRGLGLAVSRDGGGGFALTSPLPGSADPQGAPNGGQQGLLMNKLAVNGDGEVAVVNSSFRQGEASRVWLMRASLKDGSSRARR